MKNNKKKLLMALALGAFILSGFAINASAINDNNNLNNQVSVIKEVKNNPFDFLKAAKVDLNNFNYIDQLNKEFVDDFGAQDKIVYKSGDSLKALEESGS